MTAEEAVLKANDEWIAALNAGDVEGCVNLLTEDVAFLPPNDVQIIGRASFRAWGKELFCQVIFLMSLKSTHVWVSGDLACLWGSAGVMSRRLPEKNLTEDLIKWVHVFKRQPDGSWKMALNTWNSDGLFPMN